MFNGLLYGGDMAPAVKQDAAGFPVPEVYPAGFPVPEVYPAGLTRVERIDWGSDYGRLNRRSLGDLRRLLRELADWPDDAVIESGGVTAYRELPLHTGDET